MSEGSARKGHETGYICRNPRSRHPNRTSPVGVATKHPRVRLGGKILCLVFLSTLAAVKRPTLRHTHRLHLGRTPIKAQTSLHLGYGPHSWQNSQSRVLGSYANVVIPLVPLEDHDGTDEIPAISLVVGRCRFEL
jgi:hypothetical protein